MAKFALPPRPTPDLCLMYVGHTLSRLYIRRSCCIGRGGAELLRIPLLRTRVNKQEPSARSIGSSMHAIGSRRRSALTRSRARVASFSFTSRSLRAASHSSGDTTSGRCMPAVISAPVSRTWWRPVARPAPWARTQAVAAGLQQGATKGEAADGAHGRVAARLHLSDGFDGILTDQPGVRPRERLRQAGREDDLRQSGQVL